MRDFMIETRALSKKYGALKALNQVSVHVRRGDIYGLIGDNGAGKSTLLKILTGLAQPTGGDIFLFGESGPAALSEGRRRIGALVEEPSYYPTLSVEKNLECQRLLRGTPGKHRVEEVLRLVGLWERRKSKCKNLSMGMKKRLGLALALIGEPELLILDEPINGLDPSGIVELRHMLRTLNEERHMTILLSSHILSELEQTATTFGFLRQGTLVEEVSAKTLAEKCADYVAVRVNDTAAYAALLDRRYLEANYQLMPDGELRIYAPVTDLEAYSQLAMAGGLLITGLERHQTTLEDYYMQLKGEKRYA